jgi:hypothetical protein
MKYKTIEYSREVFYKIGLLAIMFLSLRLYSIVYAADEESKHIPVREIVYLQNEIIKVDFSSGLRWNNYRSLLQRR